ncbi:hypothetical protein [Streptomyces sp. x-80]|uniref:hypothetical protein n=1 Tax=Streptomyces sp. x-80 TaxID=2789282 RepID=UPI00397EC2E6
MTSLRKSESKAALARALVAVRQHIQDQYSPGERLPPTHEIAAGLNLPYHYALRALRQLDAEGVIARTHSFSWVLHPGELNPRDAALEKTVRERINSGRYTSGQPVPIGLLGTEHSLTGAQVQRACRRLIAEGVLRHDEHGRHGPGLYITAHTPIPDQRKP